MAQLTSSAVYLARGVVLPYYARPDLADTYMSVVAPLNPGFVSVHETQAGYIEITQTITFTYVTSAAAGNRSLGILSKDSANNVKWQVICNGTQPPSTSYRYTFMLDAGGSFVTGIFGMAPLPFIEQLPDEQWSIAITNGDAGDQQNGLTYIVHRIPTGPNDNTLAAPPTQTIPLT